MLPARLEAGSGQARPARRRARCSPRRPSRSSRGWRAALHMAAIGRYCCKTIFGAGTKNGFLALDRIGNFDSQNRPFGFYYCRNFPGRTSPRGLLQQYRPTSADLRGAPKSSAYLRYYRRADRTAAIAVVGPNPPERVTGRPRQLFPASDLSDLRSGRCYRLLGIS